MFCSVTMGTNDVIGACRSRYWSPHRRSDRYRTKCSRRHTRPALSVRYPGAYGPFESSTPIVSFLIFRLSLHLQRGGCFVGCWRIRRCQDIPAVCYLGWGGSFVIVFASHVGCRAAKVGQGRLRFGQGLCTLLRQVMFDRGSFGAG